ncbi:MAG: hypothetical protein EZS28_052970, partial [Streblomastix strix]
EQPTEEEPTEVKDKELVSEPAPVDEEEEKFIKGDILVEVIKATGLPASDLNGLSDPYVVLQLQGNRNNRTTVKKEELNPVWNETFILNFDPTISRDRKIIAEIYDYDRFNKNDMLGSVKIPFIDSLQNLQELVFDIQGNKDDSRMPENAGKLYLTIVYDEEEKIAEYLKAKQEAKQKEEEEKKEEEPVEEPVPEEQPEEEQAKERGGSNLQEQEQQPQEQPTEEEPTEVKDKELVSEPA